MQPFGDRCGKIAPKHQGASRPGSIVDALQQQFIEFALQSGVLKFGEFRTKAGRLSPYFFNAGLFNRGATLGQLARFYARTLLAAQDAGRVRFDMLFGPAYKGITLASATAVALADLGADVPFAFNRKEAKDHGEGGVIVGSQLAGRVVIVDDVITAGTSVRESVELIRAAGATPAGVLIALDRMERSGADGLIVTGTGTGRPASLDDVARVKVAAPGAPVFVGSGVTAATIGEVLRHADGVIVGTALKVDGEVAARVDPERARMLVAAARG